MSINDGQLANETNFNNAYISRLVDSNTSGKVDLDETSTTAIKDLQRVLNEIADQNGIANQSTTDANAKIYSSTNVVSDGVDQKTNIGSIDAEFDAATGHDHDGANSAPVDAANLTNVNNFFAEYQSNELIAASGTSIDESAAFAGKVIGGDSSTLGVIVSLPGNRIDMVEKDTFREIEDTSGRRVYARVTEAAGVWTLSFYVNIAGVETAHNLASQDIQYAYREVFSQFTRPTLGSNIGLFDSLAAVEDVPDATATQPGKVNISSQTFAGAKEFTSRPTTNGVDIVDVSSAQVITNKDIDGGTASNTKRLTLPNDTTSNLTALDRKEGTLYYSTDDNTLLADDGATLSTIGGGASGGLDTILTETFESLLAAGVEASGNNATFKGAGALVGVLSDEETVQISGNRSLKYQFLTGALNDYVAIGQKAIEVKQQGETIGVNFYADSLNYSADVEFTVYDNTNSTLLTDETTDLILANTAKNRYSLSVDIPSDCLSISYGFHVKANAANTETLLVDDFEFSINPFVTQDLLETAIFEGSSNAGEALTADVTDIPFIAANDSGSLWDGSKLVAPFSGTYTMSGTVYITSSVNLGINSFIDGAGSKRCSTAVTSNVHHFSVEESLQAGQELSIRTSTGATLAVSSVNNLTVSGSRLAPHIITPARSNLTDWIDYTPTYVGLGAVVHDTGQWKRVGDSMFLRGRFTMGTGTAVAATFTLPSGYSYSNPTTSTLDFGRCSTTDSALQDLVVHNAVGALTGTTLAFQNNSLALGSAVLGNAFTAGRTFLFSCQVKIEGWSSDAVFLAAVPVFERVYARYTSNNGQALTGNTLNVIKYEDLSIDTHAAYNSVTGIYTVPISGFYHISAGASYAASISAAQTVQVLVYHGSAAIGKNIMPGTGLLSNFGLSVSSGKYLNAGDTVTVHQFSQAGTTLGTGAEDNHITIFRVG